MITVANGWRWYWQMLCDTLREHEYSHLCCRCQKDCDCAGYHMLDCAACKTCREEIKASAELHV